MPIPIRKVYVVKRRRQVPKPSETQAGLAPEDASIKSGTIVGSVVQTSINQPKK